MANVYKKKKEGLGSKYKIKSMGDHREFLRRITKTLYYGHLPMLPCLSLPVTEISCAAWSEGQRGRSVRRLHADAAAKLAHSACVSPCTLVLALLYLEKLHDKNPNYVEKTEPCDLFLISLLVGNKFLQDDGEDEEVMSGEWAAAAGMDLRQLNKLELDFLKAIDWSVYVNDELFESRLLWLERQVALRQSHLNGFFTYTDLAVTCDSELLATLLRSLSFACLSVTLAYLAGFLAILTSSWVIGQALCSPAHSPSKHFEMEPPKSSMALNDTVILEGQEIDQRKCCTDWLGFQLANGQRNDWYEDSLIYEEVSVKPWWSQTRVFNWLYYSSLVNPMQKWLDERYSTKISFNYLYQNCHENFGCIRLPVNMNKIYTLQASV